ncbi:hypothetical protein NDU88_004719 [Pleurodeles waltl]|uniref:Uncharacterized protein n=1 Tax=Pleurodeles waltl TaxID=8319 RepID=A0AAV7PG02_PLEWA|nr:hypothetical protein NDU88_004719 [Pleurodeles waltl]
MSYYRLPIGRIVHDLLLNPVASAYPLLLGLQPPDREIGQMRDGSELSGAGKIAPKAPEGMAPKNLCTAGEKMVQQSAAARHLELARN